MKSFKAGRAFSLLTMAFLAVSSPAQTNAAQSYRVLPGELSESYNRGALAYQYRLSCTAREQSRADNIRRPIISTAFPRNGNDLVLYSPSLRSDGKSRAQQLIGTLPNHVRDLFYQAGGVYVIPSHTMAEAFPRSTPNNFSETSEGYIGLYLHAERRIFLPMSGSNLYGTSTTHHEMGHFVDNFLGDIGGRSFANRFSSSESYISRIETDLAQIAKSNLPASRLRALAHYLPYIHDGKVLYGENNNMARVRREVFGELWAEANGHNSKGLGRLFPYTYQLVYSLSQDMKNIHAVSSSGSCRYRNNL